MADRLTTGVDSLDRALGGGIRSGSIVAVSAPPDAQSEPLLRAAMTVRPTLYVSTIRSAYAVQEVLDLTVDGAACTVERTGVETPVADARAAVDGMEGGCTVVIDAVNPLESRGDEADYLAFLNDLDRGLSQSDSIGLLHCLETEPPTDHREFTLAVADLVLDLEVETSSTDLEFQLEIPRARATSPDERRLSLELGRDIAVDNSRDIA